MSYKNKEAKRKKERNWAEANPERYAAIRKRATKKFREKHGYRELFDLAKARAKKHNLPFNITREWFIEQVQKGTCSVTGIPFVLGASNPFSPSLDQKQPKTGYTLENTQVVVLIYNLAKNQWTHGDVMFLVNALHGK